MRRTREHASNNSKFAEDKAGSLKTRKVDGDKPDRELAEQAEINRVTGGVGAGSNSVSNKVNPFKRRAQNGMSGVTFKICSGMGAQAGGC